MKYILLILCGIFAFASQLAAFVVVIPEDTNKLEKIAQQELVTFLEQASGRKVSVVKEKESGKIANGKRVIYLGNTAFAQKNKIQQ